MLNFVWFPHVSRKYSHSRLTGDFDAESKSGEDDDEDVVADDGLVPLTDHVLLRAMVTRVLKEVRYVSVMQCIVAFCFFCIVAYIRCFYIWAFLA